LAHTSPPRRFSDGSFGVTFTDLTRFMLWLYGGIWMALVLLTNWMPTSWSRIPIPQGEFGEPTHYPLWQLLVLYPPGDGSAMGPGFHLWQLLTAHFVHPPAAVFTVVLNLLMLVFFVGPVENMIGRRRLIFVWIATAVGAGLGTIVFGLLQGATASAYGIGPGIITLVVVFCALMPEATINLFFILPLKAKYLGWFTAGMTVLYALAAPEGGGFEVGGLGFGYAAWRWGDDISPRRLRLKMKARKLSKKIAKFEVIDGGGKGGKDDPPVFH